MRADLDEMSFLKNNSSRQQSSLSSSVTMPLMESVALRTQAPASYKAACSSGAISHSRIVSNPRRPRKTGTLRLTPSIPYSPGGHAAFQVTLFEKSGAAGGRGRITKLMIAAN
jgi:hypothetical protein